ncbi:hypothetical protein ACIPW5_03440 [Streptomyces sp. NPDC090077]|uniref:hypothetical protein n=1 Tax=Streptomyces sp. NPDC090077 TaxID=3365938 RepID=UPI0037F214F1
MSPFHRRSRRLLTALAVLCGALPAGACAADPPAHGDATAHAAHAGAAPAGKATTVEELASALGCTAESVTEADELRQGACSTGQGAYRLTTFTAEEGLRSWLAETRTYGGVYLVGDRWVVTAPSAEALTALRERMGGTVETGTEHTGH